MVISKKRILNKWFSSLFEWLFKCENIYGFDKLKGYDTLIMSTEPVQNENILIVDLDEDLVKAYEGYPLPRSLYAELITKTNAVPGITVLMPDADIRGKENDTKLSIAMRKVPTVLASAASAQTSEQGLHVGTAQLGEDPLPWLYQSVAHF